MAGRPKAIIDWNKVDKYLQAQCDGVGIAGILGIAPLTLYRACEREKNVNFDTYSAQKKGEGVELLKAKQFQTAMEGNVVMQIWLGKQYAGQRDKQDIDQTINQPIQFVISNENKKAIDSLIEKVNEDTKAD